MSILEKHFKKRTKTKSKKGTKKKPYKPNAPLLCGSNNKTIPFNPYWKI